RLVQRRDLVELPALIELIELAPRLGERPRRRLAAVEPFEEPGYGLGRRVPGVIADDRRNEEGRRLLIGELVDEVPRNAHLARVEVGQVDVQVLDEVGLELFVVDRNATRAVLVDLA